MSRWILFLVLGMLAVSALPSFPAVAAVQQASGVPGVLSIQSAPPSLPADGRQYQSIMVSLQDKNFRPTLAVAPVSVNLFSSQPNVAAVNATVTIQVGHDYALATLTTTNTPGATVITASSTGFQSAFVTVNTVTPSGLASELKVFPAPASILSNQGESDGLVYVELGDVVGLPAKSATDVTIQLSSSNPLVVGLALNNITIPAGEIFATVHYTLPSTSIGSVTISAFSTGFSSGNGVINVVASPGQVPCCKVVVKGILATQAQTSETLPADGRSYSALEILLQDLTGGPARAPSGGITVQLSSSKDTVVHVASTAFMPSGTSFVIIDAQASFLAGTANITAFATGYSASSTTTQTVIPAPSKLTVYVAPTPKVLTTVDQLHQTLLVVQLQDAVGSPARAKADTSILVTSSNSSVVPTTLFLTIPKGEDFVSTFVQAVAVGFTTFTASSSGLSSSQTVLTTIPLPLTSTLAVGSNPVLNTEAVPITLSVTLEGQPLSGATVLWTVTNGNLSASSTTTNTEGTSAVTFKSSTIGVANITAVVIDPAIGQTASHVVFSVIQIPPPPQPSLAQEFVSYSYLLLIPVAIVIIYLVFRLRRRRAKRRAELEAAFQTVG